MEIGEDRDAQPQARRPAGRVERIALEAKRGRLDGERRLAPALTAAATAGMAIGLNGPARSAARSPDESRVSRVCAF